MLDFVLIVGSVTLLVILVLLQRRYDRRLRAQRRLSDRLWAQALQDMKQSAKRKRID